MGQQHIDAKTVFNTARKITDAGARASYVELACGPDLQAKQRVQDLLRVHDEQQSFLESPPPGVAATRACSPLREQPGDTIGPYKLLQQIGEGGMGIVYMADQHEPVRRKVALKIIKPGLDTQQVIARFEAERQALSLMDHPHIARVLDAGTTTSGRPYFAMELVKGQPITEYCDEKQLTLRERLELMLPVCQAVQHAHQKGIIHRDLKPSNILVAEYDLQAVPKVIDFGVAKAIHQPLTEKTMFTGYGQIVGTLEYMSPEQAKVNQLDIDTRSDVYSLGVLLYELLTGGTPFDKQRLRAAAWDEMLRIIREEEPPRPSMRLSTSGAALPSISAQRHTESAKLTKLVRGELDWIVMKALEKDRNRRYATANGLAMDIQRYMQDEAVTACPPSAGYRLRKFARRNRAALATGVLLTGALVLGSALSTWQAVRATRAERTVSELLASEQASRYEAEQAREREMTQRRAAEQAGQAEGAQRVAAEAARNVAETARQEAVEQRRVAGESDLRARRNLYTAHMNLAQEAWRNTDISRVLDLLQRHVPAPGEPDWRSFEWYHLLNSCTQDELSAGCGHSNSRPVFSPDGKTLAIAVWHKQVELWDIERRERRQVIPDATCGHTVAYSPDGNTLAYVGGSEVKLCDATSGQQIRAFGGHQHTVLIAFTPDGARLISTDGGDLDTKNVPGVIRVWDLASGDMVHEMRGHDKFIHSMAVSPDGRQLASAGYEARFWDLETGKPVDRSSVRADHAIAWSPLGTTMATFFSGQIVIWDVATGQPATQMTASRAFLAYSPDGRTLASAHFDGTVRLWDVATGSELAQFKGHSQWLFYVTFSPDGRRVASVSRDCTVKVWPVVRDDPLAALPGGGARNEFTPGRDRFAMSPDGAVLAVLADNSSVALVDSGSGVVRSTLGVGQEIRALAMSADGNQLAVGHERGVEIWDTRTAGRLREQRTESAVWTLDWSPDAQRLAIGTDARQIEILAAPSLERLAVLPHEYNTPLRKVAFSPDGLHLAATTLLDPAEVHVWELDSRRLRFRLEFADKFGRNLAFSADGGLLAACEGHRFQPHDGAITRIIDMRTGREVGTLQGNDAAHTAVTFSRDGNSLITASEQGAITLWDLQTLEERTTLRWDGHVIESLTLTPDGRTLVASDNRGQVRLWRSAKAERIQQTEIAGLHRRAAQYASDGRLQEAVELFSHLLTLDDSAALRANRAQAYAEMGEWNAAASDLELVTRAAPSAMRRSYELALAQLLNGDVKAYRETCARMLASFGGTAFAPYAELVCWTCVLHPQTEQDGGRLLALAAAPSESGDMGAVARCSVGAVLLRAGLYEDAIAELQAANETVTGEENRMTPEYTWYLLAQAHARLGQLATAAKFVEQTRPLPPPGSSRRLPGKSTDELPWFRRATLQLLRDETLALLQAPPVAEVAAQRAERAQRAVALCSQAIVLRGEAPVLWRLRARARERLGDTAQAAADLACADQLDLQVPLRKLTALISGNRDSDMILNNHFLYDRALYRLQALKDMDGALHDCVLTLRIPDATRYRQTLKLFFEIHAARGTLDQAQGEWLREFGDGQLRNFYQARAEYYRGHGAEEKAGADLEKSVWMEEFQQRYDTRRARADSSAQDAPWPHLLATRNHWLLNDRAAADTEMAAAVAAAPDDPEIWMTLAILHEVWMGDIAAAETDWARATELAGADPLPWIHRGRWYAQRGEGDKADADFARAASLAPQELNKFLEAGWWVAGPYPAELKEFCPPELAPDPSTPVQVVDPRTGLSEAPVRWRTVPAGPLGRVAPVTGKGVAEGTCMYALALVHSPDERTATLWLGNPEPVRCWVNGQLQAAPCAPEVWRLAGPEQGDTFVPICLRAGRNTLLLKFRTPYFVARLGDHPLDRGQQLLRCGLLREGAAALDEAYQRLSGVIDDELGLHLLSMQATAAMSVGDADMLGRIDAELIRRKSANLPLPVLFESTAIRALMAHHPVDAGPLIDMVNAWRRETQPPGDHWQWRLAALLYYRAGRWQEAVDALTLLGDSNVHACPVLAMAYYQLGRSDEAHLLLTRCHDLVRGLTEDFPEDGSHYLTEFCPTYREACALIEGSPTRADNELATLLNLRREQWQARDRATADFDDAVHNADTQPQVYLARGRRLADLGRLDEAASDFNRAVAQSPHDAEVLSARAVFYADRGHPELAAADLHAALDLFQDDTKPRWAYGKPLDLEAALRDDVFDRLVAMRPDDVELRRTRMILRVRQGRLADADADVQACESIWHFDRAAVALLRGDRDAFERIRSTPSDHAHPAHCVALLGLAPVEPSQIAELRGAATALEDALAKNPGEYWLRHMLGLAHLRLGEPRQAIALLETCCSAPSGWIRDMGVWPLLAIAHHQNGDTDQARTCLNKAAAYFQFLDRVTEDGWPQLLNPPFNPEPHDWLMALIYYREAQATIEGHPQGHCPHPDGPAASFVCGRSP